MQFPTRIYISGKITGTNDYMRRFQNAEDGLYIMFYNNGLAGNGVVNPAKVLAQMPDTLSHNEYMKLSICMLSMCDTICMLKGWEDSKGAQKEYQYAKANNYKIIYEK
jgi:hypothetical protein